MVSIPLHGGPAPHTAMRDALGWSRVVVATLARGLVTALLGMALWAAAPAALGWSPTTVVTGSMEPRIAPGDVVVARPVPASELRQGLVLLADDPDQVGHLRMHRYVEDGTDGTLVTKGDANPQQDSTPLERDAVHGVAVLRVPFVGLPVLWVREGAWARVAALAVGLGAVLWLCAVDGRLRRADDAADETDGARGTGDDGDGGAGREARGGTATHRASGTGRLHGPRPGHRHRARHRGRARSSGGLAAVTAVAALVGALLPSPASAAPWGRTTASAVTLTAGTATAATDPACVPNGDGTVSIRFGYGGPAVTSFSVVNVSNGAVIATGSPGSTAPVRVVGTNALALGSVLTVRVRTNWVGNWTTDSATTARIQTQLLGTSLSCA